MGEKSAFDSREENQLSYEPIPKWPVTTMERLCLRSCSNAQRSVSYSSRTTRISSTGLTSICAESGFKVPYFFEEPVIELGGDDEFISEIVNFVVVVD